MPGRTSQGNAVPEDCNNRMRPASASVRSLRHDTPALIAGFTVPAGAAMRDSEVSKGTNG